MSAPGSSSQVSTVLGVSNFVWERRQNIEVLKNFNSVLKSRSNNINEAARKRKIDSERYRTRSYRRFKIRKVSCPNKKRFVKKMPSDSGVVTRLTTHKWHSKRMKMKYDNGVLYAERSASLGCKAIERIVKLHSVIHDMSMYKCLLLKGSELLETLANFTVCFMHRVI